MLLDQSDFLVVGVMGLQGVGKSTVMSLLAGGVNPLSSRCLSQSLSFTNIGSFIHPRTCACWLRRC